MDSPGKHLDEPLNISWIRNFSTKCGTQGEEYDAMIRTLDEYFNDLEYESLSPVTATDQSMIDPAVCHGGGRGKCLKGCWRPPGTQYCDEFSSLAFSLLPQPDRPGQPA